MNTSTTADPDLGAVVGVVRHSFGQIGALLWFVAIGGLPLGIGILVGVYFAGSDWAKFGILLLVGPLFCIMSPLLLVHLLRARTWHFTVCERGIALRHRKGEHRFRFDDVARFGFAAIEHYVNGAYVGLNYKLRFVLATSPGNPIEWSMIVNQPNAVLDALSERLSGTTREPLE